MCFLYRIHRCQEDARWISLKVPHQLVSCLGNAFIYCRTLAEAFRRLKDTRKPVNLGGCPALAFSFRGLEGKAIAGPPTMTAPALRLRGEAGALKG